jgi:tetratricopeptide (TPR) repeat protein
MKMLYMRYRFFYSLPLFLVLFCTTNVFSQGGMDYVDSLKRRLDTTRSTLDKINLLMDLARVTMDRAKGSDYANQAIELAQETRDQRLIADIFLQNGGRYGSHSDLTDNLVQATKNYQQAGQIAKEYGLEDILVEVYSGEALVWHSQGDDVKALSFCTQALAMATGIESDSAKAVAFGATGDVYRSMNQMLLALRNYLSEMDVAEKSGNDYLLRNGYVKLVYFYDNIGEYDKAIDYRMKAYALDRKLWDNNMSFDLLDLGTLYLQKGQLGLAEKMYQRSIRTADTLHFALLKVDGYQRMFQLYLKTQQYKQGLQYLHEHQALLDVFRDAGFGFYYSELLAINYSAQGRYDSAYYYFREGEPEVAAQGNPEVRFGFYMDFGDFFRRTKNWPQALAYCNKAYAIAAASGQLDMEEKSTDTLERLYQSMGNYEAALDCEQRAGIERDSIKTQSQAIDLMKLEVENEGRRRERLAREEQERTEHRHNLQYMGFTMGLVALFVVLVMLARLSVPVSLIRAFVFMAFIFLFEFIIMLADKQIQGWTAEEPWKVLLLKIVLAAGMVPAHHWLEHKVVLYLSRHKKDHGQGTTTGGHGPGDAAKAGHGTGETAGPQPVTVTVVKS